ncbi:MAG: hypothetical protein DRI94_08155 [Bacteroidetes bacterium]|nr:MAG: hypothetical protein DRI94_08155 [Bacteroidota bacterium]
MKRTSSIIFLFIVIIVISFLSCKTKSISVKVLKPAEIYVPSNIKTLAVVNRSLPAKGNGNQFNNVVEGIISGEGLFVDREASQRTVNGLADGLQNSPRFSITVLDGLNLRGTGTAKFPAPLPWQQVSQICRDYSADALILLETFDSNTSRRYGSQQKTIKEDNKDVTYTEYNATIDISINAGWRIYDPKNQKIVDQNVFTDRKAWNRNGRTKTEAQNNLPKQAYAVKDAGYYAGKRYAVRISPNWIWVSRHYFVKGNDDFKNAKYKADAKQWQDAADIWKRYVNDPDIKIAGRACYNMALASEIFGKFDVALDWAQKAYADYRLKDARQYINILENRIRDAERLDRQMND